MKVKVLAVNILDAGDNLVDARIVISCVYKLGNHDGNHVTRPS